MKLITTLTALLVLSVTSINAQESILQFRAVSPTASDDTETLMYSSGESSQELHLVKSPIITNSQIEPAKTDESNGIAVFVTLTEEGKKIFEDGIKDMQGQRIAIVVNEKVVSAPVLQATSFARTLQISGNLSAEEAERLASQLNNDKGCSGGEERASDCTHC